jgi:hypothetical protein
MREGDGQGRRGVAAQADSDADALSTGAEGSLAQTYAVLWH